MKWQTEVITWGECHRKDSICQDMLKEWLKMPRGKVVKHGRERRVFHTEGMVWTNERLGLYRQGY